LSWRKKSKGTEMSKRDLLRAKRLKIRSKLVKLSRKFEWGDGGE
jgi:hypothetical protein